MKSHSLEPLVDFVSMYFKWDIELELEENLLFTKKVLFPLASALHPMDTFLADVLIGTLQEKGAQFQPQIRIIKHGLSFGTEFGQHWDIF